MYYLYMKLPLLMTGLLSVCFLNAQQLEKHRWKNRVIILVSSSFQNDDLQNQMAILRSDLKGLEERKLVSYQIVDQEYKSGLTSNGTLKPTNEVFLNRFELSPTGFSIYLIGLDGGIKLRKDYPAQLPDLYSLIDSMPMRQSEMRRKSKKND